MSSDSWKSDVLIEYEPIKVQSNLTPQYRRSWDWRKSGSIPKTAVLGVIYYLQNPYLGLANGRRYWGEGRSSIGGGGNCIKNTSVYRPTDYPRLGLCLLGCSLYGTAAVSLSATCFGTLVECCYPVSAVCGYCYSNRSRLEKFHFILNTSIPPAHPHTTQGTHARMSCRIFLGIWT